MTRPSAVHRCRETDVWLKARCVREPTKENTQEPILYGLWVKIIYNQQRRQKMNEQYYIIRCARAGVFYAQINERRGDEADIVNARRLWYWEGAASLSQLATDGVKNPDACHFTVTVPHMTVLGICEIIPCSDKAAECIDGVKEWKI